MEKKINHGARKCSAIDPGNHNLFGCDLLCELEIIQTHMIQKPMLRVEVCTRAFRASQNVREKKEMCALCVRSA